MTFRRGRFGAAVSARPFRRGRFGAETFRRRAISAPRRFGAETIRRGRLGAMAFQHFFFVSGLEMSLTHYSNLTFAGRNEVCKLFGDEPNSTLTSPSKPCGAERGLQVGSGFSNPAGRNEVCKLFGDEPNQTLTSPSKSSGAERGLQSFSKKNMKIK